MRLSNLFKRSGGRPAAPSSPLPRRAPAGAARLAGFVPQGQQTALPATTPCVEAAANDPASPDLAARVRASGEW